MATIYSPQRIARGRENTLTTVYHKFILGRRIARLERRIDRALVNAAGAR
ncbi:MAG: hypothetical protein IPL36_05375 [Nigerium sp.]|nr:hypothetical protein [Nigerium sp.]